MLQRTAGNDGMADVDGIEGAAENAYFHDCEALAGALTNRLMIS